MRNNIEFSDLNNSLFEDDFKKPINIPNKVLELAEQKFNVEIAYKATSYIDTIYYDNPNNVNQNKYIILDDCSIYIKADEVEAKYLRNRQVLSPIEDLYYSYEKELKYAFPDSDYFEASLISGDFLNMARLGGVPSWVIHQVLEIYESEKTSYQNISLCIDFSIIVDYSNIENILKEYDLSARTMIHSFSFRENIDNYYKLMEILKDKNVPLKMRISAYGFNEDGDESDSIYLDNFNEDGIIIKDCGTFNNVQFDYKEIIDDIYNELHK